MKFGREQSMKRAHEFSRVRQNGISFAGRYLVLSLLPSDDLGESRFGIICTKKIGKAHLRNSLRRRIREVIRLHGEVMEKPHYVVTVLRWRAKDVTLADLEKDWLRAYRRIKGGEGRTAAERAQMPPRRKPPFKKASPVAQS